MLQTLSKEVTVAYLVKYVDDDLKYPPENERTISHSLLVQIPFHAKICFWLPQSCRWYLKRISDVTILSSDCFADCLEHPFKLVFVIVDFLISFVYSSVQPGIMLLWNIIYTFIILEFLFIICNHCHRHIVVNRATTCKIQCRCHRSRRGLADPFDISFRRHTTAHTIRSVCYLAPCG